MPEENACQIRNLKQNAAMRLIFLAILLSAPLHAAQDLKLDSLQVGEKTYVTATLMLEREGVVRVVHDGGVARVALKDLPENVQKALLPPPVEPIVKPDPPKIKGLPADPNPISKEERYRIVKNKRIPNGGSSLFVVVSKEFSTQQGIELVINDVRKMTSDQRNTFLFVFDDSRSPAMMDRLDELTDEENRVYEKSFKATYKKNGNTGYHEAEIMLDGLNGPSVQIVY
jgi:hypothetical protein